MLIYARTRISSYLCEFSHKVTIYARTRTKYAHAYNASILNDTVPQLYEVSRQASWQALVSKYQLSVCITTTMNPPDVDMATIGMDNINESEIELGQPCVNERVPLSYGSRFKRATTVVLQVVWRSKRCHSPRAAQSKRQDSLAFGLHT